MLVRGDKAPEFTAESDSGSLVRLSDLLTSGPLVLYFYPADFTPICTRQACRLRDAHEELAASGLRVFGVSPQSAARHRAFKGRHRLGFTLLADPDKKIIRAYEADGPFGLGVRRISYLIDADGTIRDAVKADLRLGPHDGLIRRALERARRPRPSEG